MSDESGDIDKLIEYIGGVDNIDNVSHCATRLRFILKDMEQLDFKKVENLDFVNGSFYQGGQFQVIIGNDVKKYYSKIIKNGKIKALKEMEANGEVRENSNWMKKLIKKINKKQHS